MSGQTESRQVFTSQDYRFEVYDTQVSHPDYGTLLLAWRQALRGGRRSRVILKRLSQTSDRERRERAWEEVQLATHLTHSNIAKVDGLASQGEDDFVVMEYTRGIYLVTAMDYALLAKCKLSPAFVAYVVAEVADALDYAHGRKDNSGNPLHIIHRAVSPIRIRLGFDGRVKLTNFGAAYSDLRDRMPTPPGLLRGDPAYCAPEVLRAAMKPTPYRADPLLSGSIDGRADVFSLGLILLEMLVAEYPLDPTDQAMAKAPSGFAQQLRTEQSSWIDLSSLAFRLLRFAPADAERLSATVPEPLRVIICRALHPEPSQRCWAAELRDELRAYLGGLGRPFNLHSMTEEITRVWDEIARMERIAANPLERTAFKPEGMGALEQ